MKKSRMISEIANVIHDTFLLGEIDMAKAVLAKIEELGMKPPVEQMDPVLYTTKLVWEKEE